MLELVKQQVQVLQQDLSKTIESSGKHFAQLYAIMDQVSKALEAFDARLVELEPIKEPVVSSREEKAKSGTGNEL